MKASPHVPGAFSQGLDWHQGWHFEGTSLERQCTIRRVNQAALGVPSFACTPDAFPGLMAAAIRRDDVAAWAASQGLVTQGT